MEDNNITSDDIEVAEKMNTFFLQAIETLDIQPYEYETEQENQSDDNIINIINKFKNHPSILKIKEYVVIEEIFSFLEVTENEFCNEINKLDPKKGTVENYLPAKMLIGTNDIIAGHLSNIYNNSRYEKNFPNNYIKII